MSYSHEVDRPNKAFHRELFFSQVDKPARKYLCLPSAHAIDVSTAIQLNAINGKTKVVAYERDKTLVDKVRQSVGSLTKNYIVNDRPIERDLNLCCVDLAYIDLCGQVDPEFIVWLQSVQFCESAKIAFTFLGTQRSHDTFYQRFLASDRLWASPVYTSGYHLECVGPFAHYEKKINMICGLLAFCVPGLRFNITSVYSDTGSPMLFLGGYLGRAGQLRVPRVYKTSMDQADKYTKFVHSLLELSKGVERPQQIGGLKIRWNNLLPDEKRKARKHHNDKLTKLGL